ncbi:FG-GAP repeat domain-containing protein [Streptomyces sp. NBC_00151]|uniref:FG-GAP repeat domain-containing protein n=1 Tax=Streptomyces sp. NBC_00151 TaxID=2975669 RepID=UPI002DDA732A|nr:VCBS repeat-containing protein [Streptomyces sp. NBC_00151]WRZ40645.1 VCBS repeat-containing protein [Streptomyces sp. NBC_00151]
MDEYTGMVAWFDAFEQTHVATTGVAPSAVTSFVTSTGSYVEPGMRFEGEWLLSRPVTSWSVTFTSLQSGAEGRATSTVTGGASAARVAADWYGKATDGSYFPNGLFTWTLEATGAGTASAATVTTGEGFLARGAAVRHDFGSLDGPDGRGDLLTLNSSGGLTVQQGTGTGKFGEKNTLYRYNGKGDGTFAARVKVFADWGGSYNAVVGVGDITDDGRADLVSRDTGGNLYRNNGDGRGSFGSRTRIATGWGGYRSIS